MSSTDFRTRFINAYKGDIRDPILTTLLETINAYHENIKTQHLLTTYAQRTDQISDGLFEVLRRHLFGQMFPGPVFLVAHASLRDAKSARPLPLDHDHYFTLEDREGETLLFAPQRKVWVAPSLGNDVRVRNVGSDLMLGFNVVLDHLGDAPDGTLTIFTGEVDPLLVERIRCRLPESARSESNPFAIIRSVYPGKYSPVDDFFHSPFEQRFISIPFAAFANVAKRGDEGLVWIPVIGLGAFKPQLDKKLTLNAFALWNMVEEDATPIQIDNFRYTMAVPEHTHRESIIGSVADYGASPPIEYVDAAAVLDPAYPFQFTTSGNIRRDEIILAFSPPPQGDVKVRYHHYNTGDAGIDIAAGRILGLYQGIEERIKSVTTLVPSQRLNALNDKELVWNYFRSLLASRSRWLTRDDLRAAVATYPPFAGRRDLVVPEKIKFEEQVGRVRGFLTPYTEITLPMQDDTLLNAQDRPHFEREIGLYLKKRTVHGNFLRVKLTTADEL